MLSAFTIIFTTIILSLFVYDQDAYALRQVAGQITVEIKPGETKSFEWGLASDNQNNITTIHLRAEGDGAEFISFVNDSINMEPSKTIFIPVTVSVPQDYPGGITLSPKLYATEFGESGGATVMNIQMLKIPMIIITLNEDSSLHVNWDEINQQKLESLPTIPIDDEPQQQSIITSDDQPTGFSIVSEDKEQTCGVGTKLVDGICKVIIDAEPEAKDGGGCLIATATYGTELSTQVQMLREIRDTKISSTESGTVFIGGFNQIYYSFSPTISDWERQNPAFRELVKIAITPLISSLSIMNLAEPGSDIHVLGLGILVIMFNIGMYGMAPAITIIKIKQKIKNRRTLN